MNLRQFEYILAVAEHKHFETAAEKCFITQSTLSTMISKFEDEIGITIFDRRTKPVSITKEGERIIAQLKIITYDVDQLIEITKEIKGEVSGTLKIACIPTVAPYLLPLILNDFLSKYPDLFIEVKEATTDQIVALLKARELDIGILSTPILDTELKEYPLYKERFLLFDTGDHGREISTVNDIVHWENFWLLEEDHCMTRQVVEICNLEDSTEFSQANLLFKAGSINSLIRFVKAYKGKTLLPYLASLDLSPEDHKYLTVLDDPQPKRAIGLIVHNHFTKHKTLKHFQKEILNKVGAIEGLEVYSR